MTFDRQINHVAYRIQHAHTFLLNYFIRYTYEMSDRYLCVCECDDRKKVIQLSSVRKTECFLSKTLI